MSLNLQLFLLLLITTLRYGLLGFTLSMFLDILIIIIVGVTSTIQIFLSSLHGKIINIRLCCKNDSLFFSGLTCKTGDCRLFRCLCFGVLISIPVAQTVFTSNYSWQVMKIESKIPSAVPSSTLLHVAFLQNTSKP